MRSRWGYSTVWVPSQCLRRRVWAKSCVHNEEIYYSDRFTRSARWEANLIFSSVKLFLRVSRAAVRPALVQLLLNVWTYLYEEYCVLCLARRNMPELREHFFLPEGISQAMGVFRTKRVEPEGGGGAASGRGTAAAVAGAAATATGTCAEEQRVQQLQVPAPAGTQHMRSRSPAAERVHGVVRRLYAPAHQLCSHQHAHGEPDEEHSETCPLSAQVH